MDITHIPFKGAGASIIGLMGGEVHLAFASAPSVSAQIRAGKLKAIAVTSARPFAMFPDLPTVGDTVPGYEAGGATAFVAPAKTPAAIIARLNRETAGFLFRPEIREKFLAIGLEVVAGSPEQLTATLKSDTTKWGKVIKDAKIQLE